MYIHWTNHYFPKIFGILSFVANPIFMYLIVTEQKSNSIGKYRFLIFFFAIFDMSYSTVELLAPVGIHGTGAAFVVCLTDGPFYGIKNLHLAQLAVSIRCGCISLSYGILIIHFIYRYITLFFPKLVASIFQSTGCICIFLFFITHGIVWAGVCELFLYGDNEMRDYIRDAFQKDYGVDSYDIAFLGAIYMEASDQVVERSWAGILILTGISTYAVSLYIALGYKIMKKLRDNPAMSVTTKNMHKQLFRALSVQTIIPICISFSPCLVAWYGPVLGFDLGMWNNYLGVIALSAFPFMDPVAIILLLPAYRNRVFGVVPKAPVIVPTLVTRSSHRWTTTANVLAH
ncbi:Serpentine Receptor, class J [Caenorhabditis elegans]|uniref:Serpentine Receptor, class J n=1 Tax=Caenorhabditis elegans TaxID=6239 RepID=A0A0K3AW18_CAEEL|nr:Serpentine Receptor, class J [Caenorhabditis elegans]CTQ86947.1 Serpentine Receptor, class J [Caenorhabditis elegans]|eukprot:NP_001300248.1 Serpentine Receptor, class J [Caenorhabditis elegans]